MLITQEHLDQLLALDDGVLGRRDHSDELHIGDRREVLEPPLSVLVPQDVEEGEPLLFDVYLDTPSAEWWIDYFGDGALDRINAQVAHDLDLSQPDCDEPDPVTGFTCTLRAGHDTELHVATTGRACVGSVFTV